MTVVLLEEVNPNGNVQAVVEVENDVSYFYLFGAPETQLGVKSVWIANHAPAPEVLDGNRMTAGSAPPNPYRHCRHPEGRVALAKNDLRVVWLPEGNGAALFEKDEILAIIPPWSGSNGFYGFARDCVGDGPVAWELGRSNVLPERFEQAQGYWRQWENNELWPQVQLSQLSRLEQALGREPRYFAIDGDKWPPKALVHFAWNDRTIVVTIGVALRPQPNVELATDAPELLRRIELGAVLPGTWSEEAVVRFERYLSGQSNLPWAEYTWLGPRHTIPCDSWHSPSFTAALLQHEHPGAPKIALEMLLGDPVNLLWFVPITEEERQLAINNGSELLQSRLPTDRWKEA